MDSRIKTTQPVRGVLKKANGQPNRKVKVVREPKSLMDKVIPCRNNNQKMLYDCCYVCRGHRKGNMRSFL